MGICKKYDGFIFRRGKIILKKIDDYVNSIYKDVNGDKKEITELKQEMRSHLIEAVEELKSQGKSEQESIRIAIKDFGGKSQIVEGLSEFYKVQKKFANYVLSFALIFLALGISFSAFSFSEAKKYDEEIKQLEVVEEEKAIIMSEVFGVLNDSTIVTGQEEEQLLRIFEKYQDKLNMVAVFPVSELENWLQDNQTVIGKPDTHFPIEYSKATTVIGANGVIEDRGQIVPSDYDLGTVIMSNEKWIAQYEYQDSYEFKIEEHFQSKHYGLSNWHFYQFPILFFALFSVLGIVWLFSKIQFRKLKLVTS